MSKEGPTLRTENFEIKENSDTCFWRAGDIAPGKFRVFSSSELFYSVIADNITQIQRETNHDCSIRVSQPFAKRNWPKSGGPWAPSPRLHRL